MFKPVFFGIKELVSPVVYNKWKEQSFMFFEEDFLKDLDLIRELWGSPIIINNWANGGNLKQCGLRSNLDELMKSSTAKGELNLSAHSMGKAVDLHDKLGRNLKLYDFVFKLLKQGKFKVIKRLEDWNKTYTGGGWVHIDCYQPLNATYNIF